jgi:hypothetical protein
LVLAAGCAAAGNADTVDSNEANETAAALDVNDVSFLFPLPTTRGDANDLLGTDAKAAHGPLLSAESFGRLVSYSLPDPSEDSTFHERGFDQQKNWRVVAARFDPCAKNDPKDALCNVQLRLVAQGVEPGKASDDFDAADQAMHLIYQFDGAEAKALQADILGLKKDQSTNGKELGVHPVMAKEGLKGAYATALKDIILKYAGEDRLPFATVMLTLNAGLWRFARGDHSPTGLTQAQVPFSSEKTIGFHGTTGVIGNFELDVAPPATGADNVNDIVQTGGAANPAFKGPFFRLPAAKQEAAVNAALRIENPTMHAPGTLDCVSCHQASRSLRRFKGAPFLDAKDGNPNRYVPPSGVTATFSGDRDGGEYNVHAFGYLGRDVAITQGVINSTAEVIRQLRR